MLRCGSARDQVDRTNTAVTALAPSIVTTHGPVPERPPRQPANTLWLVGVALRVTVRRASNINGEHGAHVLQKKNGIPPPITGPHTG
jgi:hypothetical protein